MDVEEFRVEGKKMIDYICTYITTVSSKPVNPDVDPGYMKNILPGEAPMEPEKWDDIMADFDTKIMPGMVHWQHPQFHAYFPSGNSFPTILAEMLGNALGAVGFSWASCPALTELELIMMNWYGKAIGLPDKFIRSSKDSAGGGVTQGSASDAIYVCMLAARHRALDRLQKNNSHLEVGELLPKLVAYCGEEAHSCVDKGAKLALIKLRILETDENNALRGETLRAAMEEDERNGLIPFFVSTILGSTSIGSFDNLEEIGQVCKTRPNCWLHVDAAYAGSGFICPELRNYMKGVEYADSFNTNPNKWMMVSAECSALWVSSMKDVTSAMVVNPAYLQHKDQEETIDLRNFGISLSRKFRALKLWFHFRKHGISGLQKYIRNHIKMAKYFENLMREDQRFEIINDVKLGLVCFRLKGSDNLNREFLALLNASGTIHMVPSKNKGRYIIRFCANRDKINQDDIDKSWNIIKDHASDLLAHRKPSTPVEVKPRRIMRTLTRQQSLRMSFTRSVSREFYRHTLSKSNLYDGATPILIPDDEDCTDELDDTNLSPGICDDIVEEDVFVQPSGKPAIKKLSIGAAATNRIEITENGNVHETQTSTDTLKLCNDFKFNGEVSTDIMSEKDSDIPKVNNKTRGVLSKQKTLNETDECITIRDDNKTCNCKLKKQR